MTEVAMKCLSSIYFKVAASSNSLNCIKITPVQLSQVLRPDRQISHVQVHTSGGRSHVMRSKTHGAGRQGQGQGSVNFEIVKQCFV